MKAAVVFGLLWAGYGLGFYGYCLVRGYDVTPAQLFKPGVRWSTNQKDDTTALIWPPALFQRPDLILPTGQTVLSTPSGPSTNLLGPYNIPGTSGAPHQAGPGVHG